MRFVSNKNNYYKENGIKMFGPPFVALSFVYNTVNLA